MSLHCKIFKKYFVGAVFEKINGAWEVKWDSDKPEYIIYYETLKNKMLYMCPETNRQIEYLKWYVGVVKSSICLSNKSLKYQIFT